MFDANVRMVGPESNVLYETGGSNQGDNLNPFDKDDTQRSAKLIQAINDAKAKAGKPPLSDERSNEISQKIEDKMDDMENVSKIKDMGDFVEEVDNMTKADLEILREAKEEIEFLADEEIDDSGMYLREDKNKKENDEKSSEEEAGEVDDNYGDGDVVDDDYVDDMGDVGDDVFEEGSATAPDNNHMSGTTQSGGINSVFDDETIDLDVPARKSYRDFLGSGSVSAIGKKRGLPDMAEDKITKVSGLLWRGIVADKDGDV